MFVFVSSPTIAQTTAQVSDQTVSTNTVKGVEKQTVGTIFQRENGSVNCILQLHVVMVTLLQESLCIHETLANCCGLPLKVGSRWIDLENLRTFVVHL